MKKVEFRIRNNTEQIYMLKNINEQISTIQQSGGVVLVEVGEYKANRTVSANALYWKWLALISGYFNKKGFKVFTTTDNKEDDEDGDLELVEIEVDKDYLHLLLKDKYLGYVSGFQFGKTNIDRQLKSTTKLSKSEFCFYMEQVEKLALDWGIVLPQPGDSEYMNYKEAQEI